MKTMTEFLLNEPNFIALKYAFYKRMPHIKQVDLIESLSFALGFNNNLERLYFLTDNHKQNCVRHLNRERMLERLQQLGYQEKNIDMKDLSVPGLVSHA